MEIANSNLLQTRQSASTQLNASTEMCSQSMLSLGNEHISIQERLAGFPPLPQNSSMALSKQQMRHFQAPRLQVGNLHLLEATPPISSFENSFQSLPVPAKWGQYFLSFLSLFAVCLVWDFLWIASISPMAYKRTNGVFNTVGTDLSPSRH